MKQTYLEKQNIYDQIIIPLRKKLGQQLRQLRENNNLSAYQVSKIVDFQVTAQDIHDCEHGRYNMPSFELVALLGAVYHKVIRIEFDERVE